MKDDPIAIILDDLMRFDDILACMVASRNMISVEPTEGTKSYKPEVYDIWDDVKSSMDYVFGMINQHSGFGEMNYRVREYEVMLYVLPDTESALVAIIPSMVNRGLIEIQMENARGKIQKIREEKNLV